MQSIWDDFGFRENPYTTGPIPPTSEGEQLLVGREEELGRLLRTLASLEAHATIEGDNGVGKTSLVAVAGYRANQLFKAGKTTVLLVPMAQPFQLTAEETPDAFERKVYLAVARAFVDNYGDLEEANFRVPEYSAVQELKKWLDSPLLRSYGGGATILGFGGSGTATTSSNTSSGFSEQGLRTLIDEWLRNAFPTRAKGGFLCVLDNLELLETSQRARTVLESLRDSVLAMDGLRWVLCGARGIMRGSASSPRLSGRLAQPMELLPISDALVPDVIERRIATFDARRGSLYVPVDADGFKLVYDIVHRNLRSALNLCEEFAFWLYEQGTRPATAAARFELLEQRLKSLAVAYEKAAVDVTPRQWELFDKLATSGGSCSPGDYGEYGFNSIQAMRPHVKSLEDANLLVSTVDEDDKRRKTIGLTANGWLVRYKRAGFRT